MAGHSKWAQIKRQKGANDAQRGQLFTKLAKFDGRKTGILSVRDFKQISGRAGRKGFDTQGSVVAQAPEHIIEKKRSAGKKTVKAPAKGEVSWSEETLEKLISRPPETLRSRFRVSHGMILSLLQKDAEEDNPNARNFQSLRELISRCHEEEGGKPRLIKQAADNLKVTCIPSRLSILTKPLNGRPACHYCGQCNRGCATHSISRRSSRPCATITAATRSGKALCWLGGSWSAA